VRGLCLCITSQFRDINFSYVYATLELGKGENPELNIASQENELFGINLLKLDRESVVLSMVKAWLPEVYCSLSSCKGICLGRDGTYSIFSTMCGVEEKWEILASYIRNIIKNKSGQPKESNRIHTATPGLPKGSNSYGNRAIVVPEITVNAVNIWGRVAAKSAFSYRNYSTGRATDLESNVMKKLQDLHLRSSKFPNESIDRNLYKLLCDTEILVIAYNKLKSKPGQMTPGVNPETLDGMSLEVLNEIVERIQDETFQFKPARRVQIPKASGGTRPLTIASPRDKIVQEAIRLILEAIFEPIFSEYSHGFRPQRGCHTALKAVRQQFQPVNWVIEGDISKCFDKIDHSKLMAIIEDKILDRRFTRLIWKALKGGYFEFRTYHNNIIGTPQGSIVSPLLANIFMSQLDEKVTKLKEEFDRGSKSKISSVANVYHSKISRAKLRGDMELVLKLTRESRKLPSANFEDSSFKKLTYVRYADDWMIGVKGTLQETQAIMAKVKDFLGEIGLTLSETKTKITNLVTGEALFLGTTIKRAREYSYTRPSHNNMLRRNSKKLRMEAPIARIINKLHTANFMKNNESCPKLIWMPLEHRQIIHMYNSVFRGYLNYYKFAHNYPRVASRIGYILKQSCAKLLATKLSLGTMARVYKKFGPNLAISHTDAKDPKKVKEYSFLIPSYKITLSFLTNSNPIIKALYGSVSITTLDNLECTNCGSDYRVEMHHVRHMKDLNPKLSSLDKLMVRANRKQIPLCRDCHMKHHREHPKVSSK
jgi:group II intron reverse transcriptase/maturase